MKFKTLTAILLGTAALAAAPVLPVTKNIWQDHAIVAEAADTVVGTTVKSSITYTLYRASNGVLHAEATGCYDSTTSVTIPASVTVNSTVYKVTTIAANAFKNKTKLTSVDLTGASNLTRIEADAFYCSSVQSVKFGTGITVKTNAFRGCSSLKTISFSGSAAYSTLQKQAFNCCTALQTVDFNCKDVSVYAGAFYSCDRLTTVNFKSGVQSVWLESQAFRGLKSLSTVVFDNSAAKLTWFSYSFAGTPLSTIKLPNTVTSIPAYTFADCYHLTNFTLPSSVTTINNYAFKNTTLSSSFTITKNVSTISNYAFYNTGGVSSYSVASGNTKFKTISGALYSADGSRLISYPQEKTTTSITINASVIPDGTLVNNRYLTSLNLPKFVRASGNSTLFTGLTALKSVTLSSTEFNKSGEEIMTRFACFFEPYSNVTAINGYSIVQTPAKDEPKFHDKFAAYLQKTFDQYEIKRCKFMAEYIDKMSNYVVSNFTDSSMNQLEKAIALHKWICDRTQYNPNVYDNPDYFDPKDHILSSVFLHKEKLTQYNNEERYVTVCQGYADCYTLLMNKAGITTHTVTGEYYDEKNKRHGHTWNLVYLSGNWYHVDVTWDDENIDKFNQPYRRYENFLCPDDVFNSSSNGHGIYNWCSDVNSSMRKGNNVATDYNLGLLGDLDYNAVINSSDYQRLTEIKGKSYHIRGDLNFDGVITQADVDLMSQYLRNYSYYGRLSMWLFTTMEH